MNQPHPLDGLLDTMFPSALQLVGAVRARDPQWVTSLTADLTHTQTMALLVAVAAMVPDDVHTDQLLLWTHGPAVQDQAYGQTVIVELGGGKECTRCGQTLPLDRFYPAPTPADPERRRPQCRTCVLEAARDRYHASRSAKARRERLRASDTRPAVVAEVSSGVSGEAAAA